MAQLNIRIDDQLYDRLMRAFESERRARRKVGEVRRYTLAAFITGALVKGADVTIPRGVVVEGVND